MLRADYGSLAPRARALVQLAVTLTAQPWALTQEELADARHQGLDEEQIEAAIGVISMFNYFTRVADATGIELDYLTPLPAFQPDLGQVTAPRPERLVSSRRPAGPRGRPRHERLKVAWESWRSYVLETDDLLSPRQRRLLAAVAAQETADSAGAEALGELISGPDSDGPLIAFARKLSREPWRMRQEDLEHLRALGYQDKAILHMITVVAHQNADSRLVLGLGAASGS